MNSKNSTWQRSIAADDLHPWLLGFFTFAVAERRLPLELRLSVLDLLKAHEHGQLTADELLAWSIEHIDADNWKIIKARVAANIRAKKLREEKAKNGKV